MRTLLLALLSFCIVSGCQSRTKQEARVNIAFVQVQIGDPIFGNEKLIPNRVRDTRVHEAGYLVRYSELSFGHPNITDDESFRAVSVFIPQRFLDAKETVTIGGKEGILGYEYSAPLEGEGFYCFQKLTEGSLQMKFEGSIVSIKADLNSPETTGPTNAICDDSSFSINESIDMNVRLGSGSLNRTQRKS